jgi:large subunit ribosomal protein L9
VGTKIKVLLTQDVTQVGAAGDIREVSGGFGRNYLIPQGYAVLATRGQVKEAEQRAAAIERRRSVERTDAQKLAARIAGITLHFVERVGEQDRLFGSVTSMDIAEKLAAQLGTAVDRRKIELDEPIKRVGSYPVRIRLMTGIEPVFTVTVDGTAAE